MRHVVICRRQESAPESFTIINRTSGEDGVQWHERHGVASQFESLVRLAIAEVGDADGGAMPALTITSRDLQSVLDNPPVDDQADLLTSQPGVGLVVLMPIRLEDPTRTRYERWARLARHTHGLTGAPLLSAINSHPGIFIQRQWSDRLLDRFNAGSTVQGFSGPTFREFSNSRRGSATKSGCARCGKRPTFCPTHSRPRGSRFLPTTRTPILRRSSGQVPRAPQR